MCGIAGVFAFNSKLPPLNECKQMLNSLKHRGPDHGTYTYDDWFFLGHRRLAIIDIECGIQPMFSSCGRYALSFNGEIYNFKSLRDELHRNGAVFKTHSDTEVVLHSFLQWGADAPAKLSGMFAFAVVDRFEKTVFLARDRFGEKPLFYSLINGSLRFASELKAFQYLSDQSMQLEPESLASYLSLNYVAACSTMLKGVVSLAPASSLYVDVSGECQSSVYWQIDTSVSKDSNPEEIGERFDNAVAQSMVSDVPVGILLSGGIDSSLIAESASRQGGLDRAYCLDFEESSFSELDAAKAVASRLGIPLHREVMTAKSLMHFSSLVEHADDPLADSSSLAVWTIAKAASKQHKVVLGGDGGDELFAGYLTYAASSVHKTVTERLPSVLQKALTRLSQLDGSSNKKVGFTYKLKRFLRAADRPVGEAHILWNGTWLPEQALSLLNEKTKSIVTKAYASFFEKNDLANIASLKEFQRYDLREYLCNDILVKGDRMSMAHGLELRSPFLNHAFAEFAYALPDSEKISPLLTLKASLRRLASERLGSETAKRKKQGFSIPVHAWIRGELSELVKDSLSSERLKKMNIFNENEIQSVLDLHFQGSKDYGFEIWGLTVLSIWYQKRVINTAPLCVLDDLEHIELPAMI